jgi:hypothetical protein
MKRFLLTILLATLGRILSMLAVLAVASLFPG